MSNINNENDLQAAKDYINNSNAAALLKAKELVDFYYDFQDVDSEWAMIENAKLCALRVVDEILEATKTKYKWGGGSPEKLIHVEEVKYDTYWQEVKQEIKKL